MKTAKAPAHATMLVQKAPKAISKRSAGVSGSSAGAPWPLNAVLGRPLRKSCCSLGEEVVTDVLPAAIPEAPAAGWFIQAPGAVPDDEVDPDAEYTGEPNAPTDSNTCWWDNAARDIVDVWDEQLRTE